MEELFPNMMLTLPIGWKCEPMQRNMYLVGLHKESAQWEVVGVFKSIDDAADVCTTPCHFIHAVMPDESCKDKANPWPMVWYPTEQNRPDWAR